MTEQAKSPILGAETDASDSGVTYVEVTPEMLDAGASVHTEWEFGAMPHPSVKSIVREIFEAMAAAATPLDQ